MLVFGHNLTFGPGFGFKLLFGFGPVLVGPLTTLETGADCLVHAHKRNVGIDGSLLVD